MSRRRENATDRRRGIAGASLILFVGACSAAALSHGGSGRVPVGSVAREPQSHTVPAAAAADPTFIERGRHLVTSMGCWDCHTPHTMGEDGPEPDDTRMLSGHPADMALPDPPAPQGPWVSSWTYTNTAWSGPWGISYTANLTPDPETGLGRWTEQQFIDALRKGQHQGTGRPLRPPMPWQAFRNLIDDDLRAMFAYLQSIPPVRNKVPEARLARPDAAAPPSSPEREAIRLAVASGARSSDPVLRGAYLVAAYDCTACHTPALDSGGADRSRQFAGHPADLPLPAPPAAAGPWMMFAAGPGAAWAGPWGTSFTANITPDPETGIGQWTEQQFVDTIRNGRHQGRGRPLLPPMPWRAFGHLSDGDLRAMFTHLKTLKPVRNRVPDPVLTVD